MKLATHRHALLGLIFVARTASAQQIESGVDASAMSLWYADTVSSRAISFTPHVNAEWQSGFAEATGTYSEFGSTGRSAEAMLNASRLFPTTRSSTIELGAFAGGSAHSAGGKTGELLTNVRLHIPHGAAELFAGVGFGSTWDGFQSNKLIVGEAGASATAGPLSGSISLTPSLLGTSTRYMDAQTTAAWNQAGTELSVIGGVRLGDQVSNLALGTVRKSWGSVSATVPVASAFSLVASGGTYPISPTQGFPGGRFISLGVRMSNLLRRPRHASAVTASDADVVDVPANMDPALDKSAPTAVIPELIVTRSSPDSVTLNFSAPGADRVEINADFTGWDPVALASTGDGSWKGSFALPRGEYQMNVRVNGGRWAVPHSLLSLVDEFGGAVGLLIVE